MARRADKKSPQSNLGRYPMMSIKSSLRFFTWQVNFWEGRVPLKSNDRPTFPKSDTGLVVARTKAVSFAAIANLRTEYFAQLRCSCFCLSFPGTIDVYRSFDFEFFFHGT